MASLDRQALPPRAAPAAPKDQRRELGARRSAIFRAVNDNLIHVYRGAEHGIGLIVCECNRSECSEPIEVTLEEYAAARASPSCFLVAPGHESGRGQRAVLRTERFVLVEERAALHAVATNGRSPSQRAPRVLIMEDDGSVRTLCSLVLEGAELSMLAASDGRVGLELARSERPDLIVMDVRMPGLDGFEFVEALRSDERTREIPVLFLSGETDFESRTRAYALGAAGYITKPFDPSVLASLVTGVLSRRGYAWQAEAGAIHGNGAAHLQADAVLVKRLAPGDRHQHRLQSANAPSAKPRIAAPLL
jgi:CheY-like chemotaxis protein